MLMQQADALTAIKNFGIVVYILSLTIGKQNDTTHDQVGNCSLRIAWVWSQGK